jgi:hypothetical protein
MAKISNTNRILLLLAIFLAAYQIIFGVEGGSPLAIVSYTVAFGVLLIACLLMIILGFEVLDSPLVVILSTLIPTGISVGLVEELAPEMTGAYLVFTLTGLGAIILTRYFASGRPAIWVLMVVHGVSGLVIFLLPLIGINANGHALAYLMVSLGGALMGLAGLLLSFLKTGRPLFSKTNILEIFPITILLATAAFIAGLIGIP